MRHSGSRGALETGGELAPEEPGVSLSQGLIPQEVWEQKLKAFLHDPPHKACCLAQKVAHEQQAEKLQDVLGVANASFGRKADHIAAAADRPRPIEQTTVDWQAQPVVTRPYGGQVRWAEDKLRSSLGHVDAKDLTEEIASLLEPFAQLEPRERFLATWRFLPELLSRKGEGRPNSEQIGPWWLVLPADTRVPDHSIWSHMRTVSAIQTALPRMSLLEVSLGGIQAFIEKSRKTVDLWASSWLYSWLVSKAAWRISLEVGPDCVIFPDLWGQPHIDFLLRRHLESSSTASVPSAALRVLDAQLSPTATMPNRLVCLVRSEVVEDVAELARSEIAEEVSGLLDKARELAEDAVAAPDVSRPTREWEAHWNHCSDAFPPFRWVAVDFPHDAGKAGLDVLVSRAEKYCVDPRVARKVKDAYQQQSPYTPNLGLGYMLQYALLGAASSSMKLAETFSQWDEASERCTVCGDRPALPLCSPGTPLADQRTSWQRFAMKLVKVAGFVWLDLRGREQLCGICFTKRGIPRIAGDRHNASWSDGKPRFPSTSSVASALWRLEVEKQAKQSPNIANAMSGVTSLAHAGKIQEERRLYDPVDPHKSLARLDGRIFYANSPESLEGDYAESSEEIFRAIEKLRESLRRSPEASSRPPTYLAVLTMDGDRMGRWLSGDFDNGSSSGGKLTLAHLVHPKALNAIYQAGNASSLPASPLVGPSRHSGLSAQLRDFAVAGVPGIVRRHLGALVYAGGDDVLAFFPLGSVLQAAEELRRAFSEGGFGSKDQAWPVTLESSSLPAAPTGDVRYWLGTGKITASTGIAVAHHSTDLRVMIEESRNAEHLAKESGRDALCISLLKRSGEAVRCLLPWRFPPLQLPDGTSFYDGLTAVGVISEALAALQVGMSPSALQSLASESVLADLVVSTGDFEPLVSRICYVFHRHSSSGRTEHARPLAEMLAAAFSALWDRRKDDGRTQPSQVWQEAVLGPISVATFIHRHGIGGGERDG